MSTDNNIPQEAVTQSINEQLIAVLRPVLHSLPLEVVKASIPVEARDSGIDFRFVKKADAVRILEEIWHCRLTLFDLFPADVIFDYVHEYIVDQGLMDIEEAKEYVKDNVLLDDMYSTEELIEHLRESSRAGEIFDSNQLAQLFLMSNDKPEMDELYTHSEIGEFITDRDISDFIDDETLMEHATDNVYLADMIDDYYGWDDAIEAVSTHVSLSRVADAYGEEDVEEWVKGEYNALSKYDVTEFRRHFSDECIHIADVYWEEHIREFVQEYGITEWYPPELIRDNYNPSDIFTVAQMLEDLSREFTKMHDQLYPPKQDQQIAND